MANQDLKLEQIPGMGPVRLAALAAAGVTDLCGLLALPVEQLAAVRGIGPWQARRIREFLRQRGLAAAGTEGGTATASAPAGSPAAPGGRQGARRRTRAAPGRSPRAPGRRTAAAASAPTVEDAVPEAAAARAEGPGAETVSEEEPVAAAGASSVSALRERLPEATLSLMEAIRQAAVTRALTRQVTRLLIVAGEFSEGSRSLPDEAARRAAAELVAVEEALQRAVQRRAFRARDQKDLADRIRRRRKVLNRLLESLASPPPGDE